MNNSSKRTKYHCSMNMVLFVFCVLASSGGYADQPADFLKKLALPLGTSLDLVSQYTVHNGLPMAIGELRSTQTSERVLSFYKKLWQAAGNLNSPGFMESAVPGWLLISRIKDNHQLVVQISTEHTRGASGFVSVMPLHKESARVHSSELPDLSVLSSNVSVDGADTSSMQVLASPLTSRATHARYLKKFHDEGWSLLLDTETGDGWVTILSRGRKRLELSFQPSSDYASVVVLHELESK